MNYSIVEEADVVLARIIRSSDLLQAGLHAPDLPGILGNGAIAGEFTTASNVMDHLLGPLFRVLLTHREWGGRGVKSEKMSVTPERKYVEVPLSIYNIVQHFSPLSIMLLLIYTT